MKRDRISLKKMQFYGYHGLFAEEKKLGQRFVVSVDVFTSLKQSGLSDNMEDSIDYGEIYQKVANIVEGSSFNLIEAVAEKISQTLLGYFQKIEACEVEVLKPDPPINGHYEAVSVQIYRERK